MNIKKMYEGSAKVKNEKVANLIYKFNKLIVNLLYDTCTEKYKGINDKSDIIVSLTSFPARINKVHIVIKTLLNQTVCPKKIILWLAKDEFPNGDDELPLQLLNLKKHGLTIEYCENLYSHKKYYEALKEYEDYKLLTVDDDILYPENMIENLFLVGKDNPGVICANRCHKLLLKYSKSKNQENLEYELVDEYDKKYKSMFVFPIGMGGVLYPKGSLNREVFNVDSIKELCITADDMWLRAMGILNKSRAVVCNDIKNPFFSIIGTKKTALYHKNVEENKSKQALIDIFERYPECKTILLDELKRERKE